MEPGVPACTPGINWASWMKLRPLSGKSTILPESITVPTLAFSVCSSAAAALTLMVSVTLPTRMVKSTRAVWSTCSVTLSNCCAWKPSLDTVTW